MLIDTHAHLDFENYDIEKVIEEFKEAGVEKVVIPGVKPDSFEKIIELTEKYDELYGALGVHPSEVDTFGKEIYKKLFEFCNHPKIVAIGEIGLDYYWDKTNKEKQKDVFVRQIEIANALKLPVVVHEREAHLDAFQILKENKPVNTVMHCFSGSAEFALQCVQEGFYISIGGVVTFKNAKKMKEVAKAVPLEFLLTETDSPYLTPHPFRGKENHPKYITLIAQEIAYLKDLPYNKVVSVTNENAYKVFSKMKRG